MRLKEGKQHVDDVSSALKRFLRDLPDGLFTRAQRLAWLEASGAPCILHQPESRPGLLTCPACPGLPSPPQHALSQAYPADRLQSPSLLCFPSHFYSIQSQDHLEMENSLSLLSAWPDLTWNGSGSAVT